MLSFVEFRLWLLAAWTAPIVGQIFEGHAIVLSRVIDITAHRADVPTRGLLLREIHFCKDGWHGIVEIHYALGLQIFKALGRVCATIDGWVISDELAYAVLGLAGSRQVIEYDRQFVLV